LAALERPERPRHSRLLSSNTSRSGFSRGHPEPKENLTRTTKAMFAICFSATLMSIAAVPLKTPTATIPARDYECGDFSAFLVGHLPGTDVHGGWLYGKSDDVLFVVRRRNIPPSTMEQAYTLTEVSPNVAHISNVDSIWQCSEASAVAGCKMAASMLANGMNTPDFLSLQISDRETIKCVETKQTQVVTLVNGPSKGGSE